MTATWDFLLDESALAAVLPAEFAHFARPVRDGLSLFLSGLPRDRQSTILRAQARLPAAAGFSERIGVLAQSSPVLQKLGQILAREQRLALELRVHLRALESLPASVPFDTIQKTLTDELGSLSARGVTLLPPAIAEASVAVVIPFRQDQDVGGHPQAEGVFKVLKPGIEEQLEEELALLERVGEHLDNRCEALGIPHLDYQESFQQVRSKLSEEVELGHEQRHLIQAREYFADEPQVHIPALFDHCTSRVTSMERLFGSKVTEHRLEDPRRKRRLAKLIAKSLIAKPVFSPSSQALFHSDPHAGNLMITDDDRLGILDWSLVGSLGVAERVAIVQILLGAITLDTQRIVMVLAGLADAQRWDAAATERVVAHWIQRVRRGQFPGLRWLMGMLDEAVQTARLRVSVDLVLFRKSLHTLEGVVAEVGERSGQIDRALSIEFLRHFAAEWPQRWVRWPASRDFATRISNWDLTDTLLSYPTTVTRFWTGHTFDILESCVRRWESRLAGNVAPERVASQAALTSPSAGSYPHALPPSQE